MHPLFDRSKFPPREPEELREAMQEYRLNGGRQTPKSYRLYHEKLARERLQILQNAFQFKILNIYRADDGWGGFEVINAVVDISRRKLLRLQWNDWNRDFMVHCEGGGYSITTEKTYL